MGETRKMKQILKIIIAAAWIDGVIQPEERAYLRRVAQDFQLANDPEIKPLLSELKPVQAVECYQWLEEYFGENHSAEDYQQLLEKISALVYSDGYVDVREAKLVEAIQSCDPANPDCKNSTWDRILRKIQKLYKAAIEQQV
ncbi:MAG: TerB family tellurite resistance protein [Pleurocapsa sp. SU_5_0]|nr:TerB family tellurite resistance protein [Pleurocapsa sp. SU_5_0]NJO95682.1 TerB family tellurite resistance protein [Pleurocapsa sp. CRU_1_2]